jgi:hypothetical protein
VAIGPVASGVKAEAAVSLWILFNHVYNPQGRYRKLLMQKVNAPVVFLLLPYQATFAFPSQVV